MKIARLIFYLAAAAGWCWPIHYVFVSSTIDNWNKFMLILACVLVILEMIKEALKSAMEAMS